mmetsp:Transcript_6225/g.9624  ORF Transcript_6225/g.9624 Transcript_6225/m.9624 type:complete len:153 (+) Transcript_6225:10-468(+)
MHTTLKGIARSTFRRSDLVARSFSTSIIQQHNAVAVVTGGSGSIGGAIARSLSAAGYRVAVNFSRSEGSARAIVDEINASGGEAIAVQADVSVHKDVQALFKETVGRWERVDVLVNNAGIVRDNLLVRMNLSDWNKVLSVNLTGAFLCMQGA